MARGRPSEAGLLARAFGSQLFDFLFPREIRDLLAAARARAADEGEPIQLRLRVSTPRLAALPWEFAFDVADGDFMCLSGLLVRDPEVSTRPRALAMTAPLRVLGMIAQPAGQQELDVATEKRRLERALATLTGTGQVDLRWVDGQTWPKLQEAMAGAEWHVLHFIGHGSFDQQHEEGVLALADEDGRVSWRGAQRFGQLVRDHRSLRLVVLNSCQSGASSPADVHSSIAATAIRRGVAAAVAMQYDISDGAAIRFSSRFYESIAQNEPVDQSVRLARWAIKDANDDSLEWAIPVLYMRTAQGDVLDRPPPARPTEPGPAPVPSKPPATQRPAGRPRPIGTEHARLEHDAGVQTVEFSRDSRLLATGSRDGTARVWDAATGDLTSRLDHGGGVQAVSLSPDGRLLATGSQDSAARVFDVATGERLWTRRHGESVFLVSFSADGSLLTTGSHDGGARILDAVTGDEVEIRAHPGLALMSSSEDGSRMATGSRDGRILLWETGGGQPLALPHDGDVLALAFSADGALLATGSRDSTARVWVTESGRARAPMRHGGGVLALAFRSDGGRLATASRDGTVRVWHAGTDQRERWHQQNQSVLAVAFSPDGTRLASGSGDETARLWDADTGRELAVMQHEGRVVAVAFSPDGALLATASSDKTARIWVAGGAR
jgi:hypothetical protein